MPETPQRPRSPLALLIVAICVAAAIFGPTHPVLVIVFGGLVTGALIVLTLHAVISSDDGD